jgi:ribosomal protein S27AE
MGSTKCAREGNISIMCEHADQNESSGNAATTYTVCFSEPINGSWFLSKLCELSEKHLNKTTCPACGKSLVFSSHHTYVICHKCLTRSEIEEEE